MSTVLLSEMPERGNKMDKAKTKQIESTSKTARSPRAVKLIGEELEPYFKLHKASIELERKLTEIPVIDGKLSSEEDKKKRSIQQLTMDELTKRYRCEIANIFSFGDNALKKSILNRLNDVTACYRNCKQQCEYSFPDLDENGKFLDKDVKSLKTFLEARFPGGIKAKYVYCMHNKYGRGLSTSSRKKTTGLERQSYTNAVGDLADLKKHNQV